MLKSLIPFHIISNHIFYYQYQAEELVSPISNFDVLISTPNEITNSSIKPMLMVVLVKVMLHKSQFVTSTSSEICNIVMSIAVLNLHYYADEFSIRKGYIN